jgi:cytochrome c oxidase assembly protein subunit 15
MDDPVVLARPGRGVNVSDPSFAEPPLPAALSGDRDRARIDRMWRGVRRLAAVGALLTFCVLVLAAAMRLQAAGIGCSPWPACRDAAIAAPADTPLWIRLSHRIAATVVSLCSLGIVFVAFRRAPHARLPRVRAVVALIGVGVLAVLGRASGAGAAPIVSLANLVGGLALLGTFVSMAMARPYRDAGKVDPVVGVTALAIVATIAAGGIVSTYGLASACADGVLCGGALHDVRAWGVLVHRVAGIALVPCLLVLGARERRQGAGWSWATTLAVVLMVQAGVGVVQSSAGFPYSVALTHHALAGVLLASTLVWVENRRRL